MLAESCVRGADLWHLGAALYLAPDRDIAFLTMDAKQREVSVQLGFANPFPALKG